MEFQRYGIYFVPPPNADWVRFCTRWLGWDLVRSEFVSPPDVTGLNVMRATETPRRYGLHGTLKPPFHLAEGKTADDLANACAELASRLTPARLDALKVTRLGRFLALCEPATDRPIGDLAARLVRDLDAFRAPPAPEELARRRRPGLSARHLILLERWGYPYVLDKFRFHITLTGPLEKHDLEIALATLNAQLGPLLPDAVPVRDIALVGERPDGYFSLIERFPLKGASPLSC